MCLHQCASLKTSVATNPLFPTHTQCGSYPSCGSTRHANASGLKQCRCVYVQSSHDINITDTDRPRVTPCKSIDFAHNTEMSLLINHLTTQTTAQCHRVYMHDAFGFVATAPTRPTRPPSTGTRFTTRCWLLNLISWFVLNVCVLPHPQLKIATLVTFLPSHLPYHAHNTPDPAHEQTGTCHAKVSDRLEAHLLCAPVAHHPQHKNTQVRWSAVLWM